MEREDRNQWPDIPSVIKHINMIHEIISKNNSGGRTQLLILITSLRYKRLTSLVEVLCKE